MEGGQRGGVNFRQRPPAGRDQAVSGAEIASARPSRSTVPVSVDVLKDPLNAVSAFDHSQTRIEVGNDGLISIVAFPAGEIRHAFGGSRSRCDRHGANRSCEFRYLRYYLTGAL